MDKKKPSKPDSRKPIANSPKIAEKPKRNYDIYFLWAVIALVSFIRYRLLSVQFERDEGEYGYIGNMLLHGIAPFNNAYSMKLPGTSFMYAIFMLFFGRSGAGVHLGFLFMNAATMYFLFSAFRKIFNSFIGLATASVYGIMAIGFAFDGFAAHATHCICFFVSLALFFLAGFMKSGKIWHVFLTGLMLGMAFIMKQQAIFFILFGGLFLIVYLKSEKKAGLQEIIMKLLLLGAGVFIPYIVILLSVLISGHFKVFWLWTFEYASKYESIAKGNDIITQFTGAFSLLWSFFYVVWLLALGGIIVLYFCKYSRLQKIFILLFLIASVCVVSSGFYFRVHYFVALLPALGLLTAIFLEYILVQIREKIKLAKLPGTEWILLSVVIVLTLSANWQFYFKFNPKLVSDAVYWGNPFSVAPEISTYIKNNTKDSDKIAVLGSEPEIYFYSGRKAATGFLYTYPLVEIQPYNLLMQEQMINEIESAKPAFIVFCNIDYSWQKQHGCPDKIYQWGNSYTHEHYSVVGFADFFDKKGWRIYWNDDIKYHSDAATSFMVILKKNAG